jgi:hypothetical protein
MSEEVTITESSVAPSAAAETALPAPTVDIVIGQSASEPTAPDSQAAGPGPQAG